MEEVEINEWSWDYFIRGRHFGLMVLEYIILAKLCFYYSLSLPPSLSISLSLSLPPLTQLWMCFMASLMESLESLFSFSFTKCLTASGLHRAYCLSAHPIAFIMKNSLSWALLKQYLNSLSLSVFSLNWSWCKMADLRSQILSSSIHLSITGSVHSGDILTRYPTTGFER